MTPRPQTASRDYTPIHPATRPGPIALTVADIERQLAFYQNILGLKLHRRETNEAVLGTGKHDLVWLTERKDAVRVRGTTGLYHFALLLPTRWGLAHLLRNIAITRTRIQGMVDHHTHLAIYLPDAEGNGIELAWDYPREKWPTMDDMLRLGNAPLDTDALFAELERQPAPWEGIEADTTMGHIHLHVAQINPTQHFYQNILGFDTTIKSPAHGMVFLAAGGYHHHIGGNTWHGEGAPVPPENAAGLKYYTILLPDDDELARVIDRIQQAGMVTAQTGQGVLVRDPSQNGILLVDGSQLTVELEQHKYEA